MEWTKQFDKLYKSLLIAIIGYALLLPAHAVPVKSTAPQTYVIKQGDTLWDIAGLYLEDPWLWPELWRNNTHINNPHLIYPGDQITLTYDESGEPQLTLTRVPQEAKTLIKLSPQEHKVIKSGAPIPLISWSLIQSHIENDLVMREEQYESLAYLLGEQEGGVRFASDDIVLSKKSSGSDKFRIVRKQEEILDDEGEILGIQVRHVADAELIDSPLDNEILVQVKESNFEAKGGDRLLPLNYESNEPELNLQAATTQQGKIVSSLQQHALLGKYDIVVIDLGQSEVTNGTVMGIYLQGPDILDDAPPRYNANQEFLLGEFLADGVITQPALKVGELVVFKVFEKVSFGLISNSRKIIRTGAIVAKP